MESFNISSTSVMPKYEYFEMPASKEFPSWFSILFASINGAGFCLNTLSLWLLATRKFVYRYKINAFIVSLCVSDFLVSLGSFYFLGTLSNDNISAFSKRLAIIIFSFSLETSLMSICFLSLERFVAICKPFRYSEILSKTRVTCILTLGWMFCLALLGVQVLFGFVYKKHRYFYINWIVFICLSSSSILINVVVYTYLTHEIHRHSLHIKSCSISSHPGDLGESTSDYTASDSKTEVTLMGSSCSATPSLLTKQRHSLDIYLENPTDRYLKHKVIIARAEQQKLLRAAMENSLFARSSTRRRNTVRQQLIKRERRSVLLCFSIVLVFSISWLPVIAFCALCVISNSCDKNDQLLFICLCFVSLNSLLDPILYFILKREFKDFLLRKICKMSSRSTSRTANSSLHSGKNSGII
ncbi:uncharacterized protein LOC105846381 [Hydra vulgaris]|uniref:uncharacterized protein LOC105846381 n=1 Tax=Hydra vulgaris TaxID=6087 RepID=UPI00064163F2|nr:uncharacterized protein LOC105846381 [Hydra vulgaris]